MPKKTKLLNIRIDADLKRAAKKIAVEDGRSLSNWVTRLIEIVDEKFVTKCLGAVCLEFKQ